MSSRVILKVESTSFLYDEEDNLANIHDKSSTNNSRKRGRSRSIGSSTDVKEITFIVDLIEKKLFFTNQSSQTSLMSMVGQQYIDFKATWIKLEELDNEVREFMNNIELPKSAEQINDIFAGLTVLGELEDLPRDSSPRLRVVAKKPRIG